MRMIGSGYFAWVDFFQIVILPTVIILSLAAAVIYPISSISCRETSERMNYNYEYTFFTGCMIEVSPNNWQPLNRYRGFVDLDQQEK